MDTLKILYRGTLVATTQTTFSTGPFIQPPICYKCNEQPDIFTPRYLCKMHLLIHLGEKDGLNQREIELS